MSEDASRAQERYEEARRLLGRGDPDGALRIAAELRAERFTAHFEIEALAHQARGEIDRAIEILEEGVARAPGVWLLWQLLGNLRSDQGRYPEAFAAYDQALGLDVVQRDSVNLNLAIATQRAGDAARALEVLGRVEDPDLAALCGMHAASMLHALGRDEEAQARAQAVLDLEDGAELDVAQDHAARSLLELRLAAGDPPFVVREHAIELAAGLIRCPRVLAWIRTSDGLVSDRARSWRLQVHGVFDADSGIQGAAGYFTSVDAAADGADEALAFAREILEAVAPARISIEETEDRGPLPGAEKGVLGILDLHLYTEDA